MSSPGKVFYNTDRRDVYIVLGKSFQDGHPITLVMWSNGKFVWLWTFSVGDHSDTEL